MKRLLFEQLVDKYLAGNATLSEQEVLFGYLDAMQKADQEWDAAEMGDFAELDRDLYTRILTEIREKESKPRLFSLKWLSVAAAVLVFISAAVYLSLYQGRSAISGKYKNDIAAGGVKATLTLADGSILSLDDLKEGTVKEENGIRISKKNGRLIYEILPNAGAQISYNTIATPRGGEYTLILPDGTTVWLNAESSLHFPTAFQSDERTVELKGEAYFEVAKNKKKPFHVRSGKMDVEVLGTHFNVSAYPDEAAFKATLLEGSVKVSAGKSIAFLSPAQQASVQQNDQDIIKVDKEIDTEEVMAWKNGQFQFKDASLKDIMLKLERWYDVEVVYTGDVPKDQFTGYISRNVSISSVLKMLEQEGVSFSIEGKKVFVSGEN